MLGQLLGLTTFLWPVPWWLCLLGLLALLADWSAQCWLQFPSTNARRLITGLVAGYGEVGLGVLAVKHLISFWLTATP